MITISDLAMPTAWVVCSQGLDKNMFNNGLGEIRGWFKIEQVHKLPQLDGGLVGRINSVWNRQTHPCVKIYSGSLWIGQSKIKLGS